MVEITVELLKYIGAGALAGAIAAGVGYLRQKHMDKFNGPIFIRTVLMGAILGGIASSQGLVDISTPEMILVMSFVTSGVERISMLVWRRLVLPVYNKLKDLTKEP